MLPSGASNSLLFFYRLADFISDAFPQNTESLLNIFVTSIKNEVQELRMKDLAMVSMILLKLKYKKGMYDEFALELIEEAYSQARYQSKDNNIVVNWGRNFVNFCTHMATLGYYDENLVNHILRAANTSKVFQHSRSFEDTMRNGIKLLVDIATRWDEELDKNHDMLNRYIKKELRFNRMLNQGALADIFLLDCLVDINFTDYKGERLDEKTRQILSCLVTKQPEIATDHMIMQNVFHHVCKVLNIRPQDEKHFIYHGFISPDSRTRDIVFCADMDASFKNSVTVMQLPREYIKDLNEGIKVVRPELYLHSNNNEDLEPFIDKKWFAIVAPQQKFIHKRKSDSTREILDEEIVGADNFFTKMYGPLMFKIERLEKMGYTVIPISYELLRFWRHKKFIHQIRKLINSCCFE